MIHIEVLIYQDNIKIFFCVRLWSVLRGDSFFFIPATTANDFRLRRMFYPRLYPLHLFPYLNSWERASISPFQCWVLNKGTTGTIFITSLVWRGPWLGFEPGTSHTRSQHSTTRLSRRRYIKNEVARTYWLLFFFFIVRCRLVICLVPSGRWTAPSIVGRWLSRSLLWRGHDCRTWAVVCASSPHGHRADYWRN